MRRKYFGFVILSVIVDLILILCISRQVQAQEIKQWPGVESSQDGQATPEQIKQEQNNKEREEKRENILRRYLLDVIELKNGNKIFGRVTGSASGAVTIFNMETGGEEAIRTKTISSHRKTTRYEVQNVIDELRDRGREDEIIGILNARKESVYGLSKESYDEQVRSADRARESLDKQLDIANKEEREDFIHDRARKEFLEDRKFGRTTGQSWKAK
jgi:hypothetical protein